MEPAERINKKDREAGPHALRAAEGACKSSATRLARRNTGSSPCPNPFFFQYGHSAAILGGNSNTRWSNTPGWRLG
eukprot:scaffold16345_cov19-Prasinocladus_malaysianus.AAC.1